MNFTSINFLNNEEIIEFNNKIPQYNNKNNIKDITPGYPENILTNKDNNLSKSQSKEYNFNIKDYYAPSPAIFANNQQNDNIIKENHNNINIISNNYHNKNEIINININDKLDFDISPQKKIDSQIRKDYLEENINNLDSIDEIYNKSDNFKYENMSERQEDKKRGKVMDRIVKGRARLNDSNKNSNNIKGSKLLGKVLGNNNKKYEEDEFINKSANA